MKNYEKSNPKTIQALFDSIAPRYDMTNHLISLGLFSLWQKKLVREVMVGDKKHLLDLCAGTGDIAFNFLEKNPEGFATLLDFSSEMLLIAKKRGAKFERQFNILQADAQHIPLESASQDGVTISFGIRNVEVPLLCFREAYRVLRPKGLFGILEATRPNHPLLSLGHRLFLRTLVPLLGRLMAQNKPAYEYLSKSISTFLSPLQLKSTLEQAGFKNVKIKPLHGGIATLIIAQKT